MTGFKCVADSGHQVQAFPSPTLIDRCWGAAAAVLLGRDGCAAMPGDRARAKLFQSSVASVPSSHGRLLELEQVCNGSED